MKNRPTIPQMPGRGSYGGGWTQPLEDVWTQLRAEVAGLQARLQGRGMPGEASSYQGTRVFEPETATYTVTRPRDTGSTWTVNYVVRDGQTYEIPIIFPGPGVFVARRLDVSVFQRFRNTTRPAPDELISRSLSTMLAAMGRGISPGQDAQTLDGLLRQFRYSLPWQWWKPQGGGIVSEDFVPSINYFWNLSDSKSQRYLASDLMSHLALLPMSCTSAGESIRLSDQANNLLSPSDGGSFEFQAPWVIERDGQATFHFRPITAMYQIDSAVAPSNAQTGYTFEDREGGLRRQSVKVQVELFGERYETLQDAMKQGALTRPVREEESR
jgi:hypothetical protein